MTSIAICLVLAHVHETARTQRFFPKIDQKADAIVALVQVEKALLNVFRQDSALGFGFQQQLIDVVPNNEINPSFSDYYAIVGDRDFHFPLERQAMFRQCQLQRSLVIHLHAVKAQLTLNVNASPDHGIGRRFKLVTFL